MAAIKVFNMKGSEVGTMELNDNVFGVEYREPGSMGSISSPSRVFKNKHLAGQYGVENVTIQNLEVVKVDLDRNAILIKGAIPGPKGSIVTISDSVKSK